MQWAAKYIGLPYAFQGRDISGLDCWGLCRLVYKEQAGIDVPSFVDCYSDEEDRDEVAKAICDGLVMFDEVAEPETFDLIILRVMGHAWHCAIYIGEGKFLHTMKGQMSGIESLSSTKWNRRLGGYFRWS